MRDNMLRLLILVLGGLILALIAFAYFALDTSVSVQNIPAPEIPAACTEEGKICPDGTRVVRGGPSCEFAECPALPAATEPPETHTGSDVGTLPNGAQPEFGYESEPGGGGGSAGPIACTMDARQCPDGSYVGRTGPKCEFICPEVQGAADDKTVTGTVLVGPTCTVVTDDNIDACADKPYVGRITLTDSARGTSYDIATDAFGTFKKVLPAGTYAVSRDQSESALPVCTGDVTIKAGAKAVHIMCDSGIR